METDWREPFWHERKIITILKYTGGSATYFASMVLAGYWIAQEIRKKGAQCEKTKAELFFSAIAVAQLIFSFKLARISLKRFDDVFSLKVLDFVSFVRSIEDADDDEAVIQYKGNLQDTVQDIRTIIEQVKNGERRLFTVSQFLLSAEGQKFLSDACRRLVNFKVFHGKLVRMTPFRWFAFSAATAFCAFLSLVGAFTEADTLCSIRIIVLQFLQYLSVTLLTLISIAAFSGITHHAQLFYIPTDKLPVTDDEKFLISLLAANSDGMFSGVSRNYSGYANIRKEGTADVFIPMHMSLFVYREARTSGGGPMREYHEDADDCIGNYEMCAISPIEIV